MNGGGERGSPFKAQCQVAASDGVRMKINAS